MGDAARTRAAADDRLTLGHHLTADASQPARIVPRMDLDGVSDVVTAAVPRLGHARPE